MSDETAEMNPKAIMMICVACAAVAIGVLVIDVQIAKNLARNAKEIDDSVRAQRWDYEVARMGGTTPGAPFGRNHGGNSVERNPGMEARTNSADPEIPMEGWDVFHADRTQTHRGPGSRNLAVPEGNGEVESR